MADMLILTYSARSMLNITYVAWGAKLQHLGQHKNDALLCSVAWRKEAGLIGVIIASIVTNVIMLKLHSQIALAVGWYCLSFSMILMIAICSLLYLFPEWQSSTGSQPTLHDNWLTINANQAFRQPLLPYFFNAASVAIPASFVLFLVQDKMLTAGQTSFFLACFFIATAIGLLFFVALAKKIGVAPSLGISMLLVILAFSSAALLGAGDSSKYMIVCIVAGFALGVDLALPPVLLAKMIGVDRDADFHCGIWFLLGKVALILSGLCLPVMAYLVYQSGLVGSSVLNLVYSIVPCICKLIALALLFASDVSYRKTTT